MSSDLNSGKKVRVFHWGGVRVISDLNSGKKVSFSFLGGVFWVRPDLDSGNNFNFPGGRGGVLCKIPEQGCFGEIWSKFSGSLAGWCITDSLSHTKYVETKHIEDQIY